MKEQIIVDTVEKHSAKSGKYTIHFVKPPAATVTLCTFTGTPQETMYLVVRGYKGIYDPNPYRMPGDGYGVNAAIDDIQKTKLQTPLEMIHMLWLLQDVTRAFTHQLVRYRVGTAFVQESMRFFGMRKEFKVLVTHKAANETATEPEGLKTKSENYSNLSRYVHGASTAIEEYVELLDRGVPDQDARGVLPTNILTNIYFDCSLRTLQNIFPQRLCCQAQQGEWQPILKEMRKLIDQKMGGNVESILRAPYERGEECGYRASFDRPCTWKKETKTT
jgi:flavin-dependent thymidylate synthase